MNINSVGIGVRTWIWFVMIWLVFSESSIAFIYKLSPFHHNAEHFLINEGFLSIFCMIKVLEVRVSESNKMMKVRIDKIVYPYHLKSGNSEWAKKWRIFSLIQFLLMWMNFDCLWKFVYSFCGYERWVKFFIDVWLNNVYVVNYSFK